MFSNVLTVLLLLFIAIHYELPGKILTRLGLVSSPSDDTVYRYTDNSSYAARRSLFNIYRPQNVSIVMLGDSITYEADWNELLSRTDVVNRGISRDITEGFINRLADVYALKPETCLIMGGINDIGRSVPVSAIFKNITKIVEGLKANNITPIVQSTLFVAQTRPDWKGLNQKVNELNGLLREYAATNNIEFVDINSRLEKDGAMDSKYTHDGVHLLGNGYVIWRDMISPLL